MNMNLLNNGVSEPRAGVIKLESTAMVGLNKKGVLKPDADGWYTVVLGALEFPNSYGATYSKASFDKIMASNNPLTRRLKKGVLAGELGHPRKESGMTEDDYKARLLDIREDRQSHTIRRIIVDTTAKDRYGRAYVAILGEVMPDGPFAHVLERKFKQGDLNSCFSVRSFAMNSFEGGKLRKHFTDVITWDMVLEPGISVAEKYNAPSLETFVSVDYTMDDLKRLTDTSISGLALESAPVEHAKIALEHLSVRQKPVLTKPTIDRPDWIKRW